MPCYNGESDVEASGASDDVSPLYNGRLYTGVYEKIPRTFAKSVGSFN